MLYKEIGYTKERERVFKEHSRSINALYEKYKGTTPQGRLDGEPWAEEEKALKSELLLRLEEIDKKYSGNDDIRFNVKK